MRLSNGSFSANVLPDAAAVDAYYVPAAGYGDCWSDVLKPNAPSRRKAVAKRVAKKVAKAKLVRVKRRRPRG